MQYFEIGDKIKEKCCNENEKILDGIMQIIIITIFNNNSPLTCHVLPYKSKAWQS